MDQTPTVAFTLEIAYVQKLEARAKALGITKSNYLRKIVKAVLDVEMEEDKNV